ADAVDYEALEPVALKGKPEPLAVYRARSVRREADVAHASRDAPLVGRGAELSLLKGTFARVLYERSAQAVILAGTPGVGKSRLVFEFRDYVSEQRELVHWRRGRSRLAVPLSALAEVVAEHAGVLLSDAREEATAKLAAAVRAVTPVESERDRLAGPLAALVAAGTGEADLAACGRFLELVASQRPLVCVFEDVHHADDGLLAFVEHVADTAVRAPLLVLCTAEPAVWERRAEWAARRASVTRIDVEPLKAEETARLFNDLLGAPPTPALVTACAGNPLYAVEAARLGAAQPPSTIEAALAARLDTLPSELAAAAADAAIVGITFWAGAVAALAGVSTQEACRVLDALARADVVRSEAVSTLAGEPEYTFGHPLVREAALARVPPDALARKREAVTAWLAGMGERAGVLAPSV
ncbi:MAG: AAA family ATPase, partial [Actinomycetota bacterium]|nr:AAA family ATPase [Actinomycetota bacterium]